MALRDHETPASPTPVSPAAMGEVPAGAPPRPWHALSVARTAEALGVSLDGLAGAEAEARRALYGPNALPEGARRHPLLRFLAQFHSAIIYFLLASACAAGLLGHYVDAGVIVAVVTINAIVGFLQEGKAEAALAAIRQMVTPSARARRDGVVKSIPVAELVPGDVVLIEAGDRVPADLRLVRAKSLQADESMLTGESVPVAKRDAPVAADAVVGNRASMAHAGTLVTAGQGSGLVVETGILTQIGRISELVAGVETMTTPLLKQIDHFGRIFALVAFLVGAAIFAVATGLRGFGWEEALMAVVAIAVGVIPEGLPAVITITLAIGVQRMAARKAVIRRLPVVETLGATSVICSDKTGTLTRNEMTAKRIVTAAHILEAGGAGYVPRGDLTAVGHDDDVAAIEAAAPLIRAGLLCNDAELRETKGRWQVVGDPMEGALVALAMKAGLNPAHLRAEWPRADELPFDAEHRFMATHHRDLSGASVVFVKGAPERVLAMCADAAQGEGRVPLDTDFWARAIATSAEAGERVLGFAQGPTPEGPLTPEGFASAFSSEVESGSREENASTPQTGALHPSDEAGKCPGLTFLGIVGFIDPPREDAGAAIAECHAAGIDVKMITGDHGVTASAIARQLGLTARAHVVTGAEIDATADEDLPRLVNDAEVFARTNPEHKLRLVRALQSGGRIVAMTGDGVNDAPALKQADVGVAMGRKGTEAAKEAAGMVLLDDNFASIASAVHEGRTVYDNIQKVIAWTLPTNGGEVFMVVAAILLGFTMPMTAAQILWINLILTVTLGLVLAFEPPEPGVMGRPPRRPDAPLLSRFLVWRICFVTALFTVGALGIFFYALTHGRDLETARTLVVNVIVVFEIFYLFSVRFLHMTSFTWKGTLGTPAVLVALSAVVVAQFAFTYLPPMQAVFETRPVSLLDGAVVVAAGVVLMAILEVEKALLRRYPIFGPLGG